KLQQRHRPVKSDVQGFVERVIKTFQEGVYRWRFRVRSNWTSPEGSAVGQNVELIEQHASIPLRLGFIVGKTRLPGVDGVTPGGSVPQAVTSDVPGVEP